MRTRPGCPLRTTAVPALRPRRRANSPQSCEFPLTRCQICHRAVAYRPGSLSEALTGHHRRTYPEALDLPALVGAFLVYTLVIGGVAALTGSASAWTLRVMRELDRSRAAHARLSVAEERATAKRTLCQPSAGSPWLSPERQPRTATVGANRTRVL